ncbi:hypothetical protein CTheo_4658 [Ceratobasidium theobromae]|uniref:Autophagy-related protein n=1 Tax=Ceratobasidium theobromae TaxID=1582974 RepID=A0A5N5QJJ8_9AGAM|nr:hypothetical protein CTheo_4658 [Ceratobasidium theobromae]
MSINDEATPSSSPATRPQSTNSVWNELAVEDLPERPATAFFNIETIREWGPRACKEKRDAPLVVHREAELCAWMIELIEALPTLEHDRNGGNPHGPIDSNRVYDVGKRLIESFELIRPFRFGQLNEISLEKDGDLWESYLKIESAFDEFTMIMRHVPTLYPEYRLTCAKILTALNNTMRSKFKDEHPFGQSMSPGASFIGPIMYFAGNVADAGYCLASHKQATHPPQVICEKADRTDIPTIDKKKYLVPSDLTVGQFVYVIRKRIKLAPEKAIFIFVDEVLPPTAALMSAIYEEHKDEDGFLYVSYSGENTFGCLECVSESEL